MATKKQRRRRQKGRRHDYEFVYVDEEGQEVEVDEPEPKPKPEKKQASASKPGAKSSQRTERKIEPPSWDRTFRRAAIFVPIMLIFIYLTERNHLSPAAMAGQGLFVVVLLILFMYAMDTFLYRAYQKRVEKRSGSPPKSK
jgi:hypothetical protein